MKALLCGFGSMGRNHFRILKESNRIKKLSVFDPYTDIPIEYKVGNLGKYLHDEKPDFAVVATPTISHKDVAYQLLEKSIPTLIEKPLASTVEEAQEILELAIAHKTKGAVGFVERFNPVVHALRKEIKNSNVFSISIVRVGPFPPRIKDVGVLVDLSVHDIDLVRFLLRGAKIEESRVYKSLKGNSTSEDNAILAMRMEGDIIANLTTNWLTPFKKRTI